MELVGKNLIGQQQVEGTKAVIQALNPATNDALAPVYRGVSDEDFERAMALAWSAFLEYRLLPDERRAEFLEAIATGIEGLDDGLVQRVMQESGLPETRVRGEMARTCNQLRLFAGVLRDGHYQSVHIDPALPDRQPLPRPDLRYRKIALGPVAVFGASNFPLAFSVAGGDTASALAAGCPVVVKAHNAHPGTAELVGGAIQRAARVCRMPEGVFALLYGAGADIGQKLVADPRIRAVGFTGSRAGGLALLKAAQARPEPIPVYAEMSSINPVYLMPGALKVRGGEIGRALAASMAMGAGQFCTSPGLVFVVDGSDGLEDFIQHAQAAIRAQAAQTMLTPGIADAFDRGVGHLRQHASLLAEGTGSEQPNQCRAHLFAVTGDAFLAVEALQDEVFGSAAVVVRCRDMAQVQAITEQLEGQLTAAIHASDDDDADQLRALIAQLERKAGRVLFNGFGTGVEVCRAMVHGGPFPATSDSRSTSVGATAIDRFLRPVCYQDVPLKLLPAVLQQKA